MAPAVAVAVARHRREEEDIRVVLKVVVGGGGKDQRVLLWEASVLVSFIAEAQFDTRKSDGIQRESSPVTSVLVFRLPFLLRDVFLRHGLRDMQWWEKVVRRP